MQTSGWSAHSRWDRSYILNYSVVDTDKLDFAYEEKDKVKLTNIIMHQIN